MDTFFLSVVKMTLSALTLLTVKVKLLVTRKFCTEMPSILTAPVGKIH